MDSYYKRMYFEIKEELINCKKERRPIVDLDKFMKGLKDREYLGTLILIGSLAFTGLVFLLYQFYWWLTSIDFNIH